MILQALVDVRMETSGFIFGKVDIREAPMHFHAIPPYNVKKSPLLNVKSYTRATRARVCQLRPTTNSDKLSETGWLGMVWLLVLRALAYEVGHTLRNHNGRGVGIGPNHIGHHGRVGDA